MSFFPTQQIQELAQEFKLLRQDIQALRLLTEKQLATLTQMLKTLKEK